MAARIRLVLASRGMNLHQISLASAQIYGSDSPSRIPHTLYSSLANSPVFGVSLAQAGALSRLTDYRIEDWMAVLGIDLVKVAFLQATWAVKRTQMIDPAIDWNGVLSVNPAGLASSNRSTRVVPVAHILRWSENSDFSLRRMIASEHPFLFAKIGYEDAFAFPELLPGSIVRLKAAESTAVAVAHTDRPSLLLVEHARGLCCGRFHVSRSGVIYVAARELAYAPVALRCPEEARILGIADMEIRWLRRFENPSVPQMFAVGRQPRMMRDRPANLSILIREARGRAGLTFREASLLSRKLSRYLNDSRYALAQSTLSDYEAGNTPIRRIEKAIALCLIYGLKIRDLVIASGTSAEHLGSQLMPAELIPALQPAGTLDHQKQPLGRDQISGPSLFGDGGHFPFLLRNFLAEMSGILRPSMRDFFDLGGRQPFLPVYTDGSFLCLVNRRKKRPMRIPTLPRWQQPAWLLLLRTGEYRCACCSVEGEMLVLYPESDSTSSPERLRVGQDVEVIGQIVALARCLG